MRSGVGSGEDAGDAWAGESAVLASDCRSEEARVHGPLYVQRRSEFRDGADREASVKILRAVALRERRSEPCITEEARRSRRWFRRYDRAVGRRPLGEYGLLGEQQLRRVRLRYHGSRLWVHP